MFRQVVAAVPQPTGLESDLARLDFLGFEVLICADAAVDTPDDPTSHGLRGWVFAVDMLRWKLP